jgi:hypothetical protein
MATLTTADVSFVLSIDGLFPAVTISGFGVDDAFTNAAVKQVEVHQGVDGLVGAGFIFNLTEMTVTIMPVSPSYAVFETWRAQQIANKKVYKASGIISYPGMQMVYTLSDVFLTSHQALPSAKKVSQELPYVLTIGKIIGVPTAL